LKITQTLYRGVCVIFYIYSMTNMKDSIILITGGTSGIGEVTARELAKTGARIIILARSQTRADAARNRIQKAYPAARIDLVLADLSSLSQIRSAVGEISLAYSRIDLLINNAGLLMGNQRLESEDGYEMTLATNYLGPFLLTGLLLDKLKAGKGSRIINLSSVAYRLAKPDFNNLQLQAGYNPMKAYANSKLFDYMFTVELDRRLKAQGIPIVTNALHPGIIGSRFGSGSNYWIGRMASTFSFLLTSPEKGAATTLHLATSEEGGRVSGKYWSNKKVAGFHHPFVNPDHLRRLWEISEELTGQAWLAG
jgi:retinol dehydrogenase-12